MRQAQRRARRGHNGMRRGQRALLVLMSVFTLAAAPPAPQEAVIETEHGVFVIRLRPVQGDKPTARVEMRKVTVRDASAAATP
jgi:hypothetical protein